MDREILKAILFSAIGSLVGSAVVLSGALFILKAYFEKRFDIEFKKREGIDKKKIDEAFKFLDFSVDKQIGVYPEILEIKIR